MPDNQPIGPEKSSGKEQLQWIFRYLITYSIFIVFLILAAFLLFRLRTNVIQIGFLLGLNQVQVKGLSNMGVLIAGILILIGIVYSEDYLRNGIHENEMWKRILRVFIVEASLILFSLALYYILLMLVL